MRRIINGNTDDDSSTIVGGLAQFLHRLVKPTTKKSTESRPLNSIDPTPAENTAADQNTAATQAPLFRLSKLTPEVDASFTNGYATDASATLDESEGVILLMSPERPIVQTTATLVSEQPPVDVNDKLLSPLLDSPQPPSPATKQEVLAVKEQLEMAQRSPVAPKMTSATLDTPAAMKRLDTLLPGTPHSPPEVQSPSSSSLDFWSKNLRNKMRSQSSLQERSPNVPTTLSSRVLGPRRSGQTPTKGTVYAGLGSAYTGAHNVGSSSSSDKPIDCAVVPTSVLVADQPSTTAVSVDEKIDELRKEIEQLKQETKKESSELRSDFATIDQDVKELKNNVRKMEKVQEKQQEKLNFAKAKAEALSHTYIDQLALFALLHNKMGEQYKQVHPNYGFTRLQPPTGALTLGNVRAFSDPHPQKRENFKQFISWCEATLEMRAEILRDRGIAEFDAYIKNSHPIDMSPEQLRPIQITHRFAQERPDLPWENSKPLCTLMLADGKQQHNKLRVFANSFWKSCVKIEPDNSKTIGDKKAQRIPLLKK